MKRIHLLKPFEENGLTFRDLEIFETGIGTKALGYSVETPEGVRNGLVFDGHPTRATRAALVKDYLSRGAK